MILHDDFREEALAEEKYLLFAREIDIFTGLRRRDADIVEKLLRYTDRLVTEHFKKQDISRFKEIRFHFGGEHAYAKKPKTLAELNITDEVIEKMLDDREGELVERKSSTDLEGEGDLRQKVAELDPAVRTYSSILLLSKVVRNSELVRDPELKHLATGKTLKHWATFISFFLDVFERATSEEGAIDGSEARTSFEKLPAEGKGFVEYFFKVLWPVMASRIIYESLGTDKLRGVFESLLDDAQPLAVRMILAFLLLDLTAYDHSGAAWAIKNVEEFIKDEGSKYLNELITAKLLTIYYMPNIGKQNRSLIERIYAETQLRARGSNAREANTSNVRNKIVESLREERGRILRDADGTDKD